jgi:hypothetical protein
MTPLEEAVAEAMRRDFIGWQLDHDLSARVRANLKSRYPSEVN